MSIVDWLIVAVGMIAFGLAEYSGQSLLERHAAQKHFED